MTISVVDLFSIGIGPSSSHTVGPMRAAARYAADFKPTAVRVELRGSLSATGKGHGTDRAVILGLAGYQPDTVDPDVDPKPGTVIPPRGHITGKHGDIAYEIIFNNKPLPQHPNGMIFTPTDEDFNPVGDPEFYFSIGGGFILSSEEFAHQSDDEDNVPAGAATAGREGQMPYPYTSSAELLEQCRKSGKTIPEVTLANELVLHSDVEDPEALVLGHLDRVWETMQGCVEHGIKTEGILPGGLDVERRAPAVWHHCQKRDQESGRGLDAMEWVDTYALAVNEENAAGGRIVTAPTNGAAGIIPAVMHYARDFVDGFDQQAARNFLLAAGAVGIIIKENASISGAEVGCQGEVGSASSMAAGGMCQVAGGTPEQVENAAEVALEHNLGLTCDPVAGLVQIPCIERNAIAAVKAINAARLAKIGSGKHRVSLDDAVETMAETGRDMLSKYKETSMGGLAIKLGLPVALTEC